MAKNKAIEVPIVAVTDERALQQSDRKLRDLGDRSSRSLKDRIASAGTDGAKLASQNFDRSFRLSPGAQFDRMTADAGRAGRTMGQRLGAGVNQGLAQAIHAGTAQFGALGNAADSALAGIVSKGGVARLAVAGIGVATVAAGKALYDLGTVWDDVTDGITTRTGKLGAELDAIVGSVERVATGVAVPLQTVGDIAGGVAQSLHLTGRPLDAMTRQIAELTEITGEALDIRDLGKLYRVFAVDASQMPRVLDDLYTASTNTGRTVNDLVDTALKAGPAFNAFGLSIGASTGLLSLLEEAGVDADAATGAMTIALKKFADGGLAPQQALRDTITQVKALSDAGNQVGAIDLAQTTFGRGFAPIFEAIRSGNLDAQALSNTLNNQTKPSIGDMADSTRDAVEAFQLLKNKIAIEFAPAAKSEFEAINRLLTDMMTTLTNIGNGDWSSVFSGIWSDLTGPFTSPNAPWRKWFGSNPPVPTDPITGLPGSQANAPANSRDRGGLPDLTIDPRTGLPRAQSNAPANSRDSGGLPPGMIPPPPGAPGGPPLVLPTERGAGSGSSSSTLPVVPYPSTDPRSLLPPGHPVTSSSYSAAQSVIGAQHRVAQQNSDLQALIASTTATAEDVQKKRNEISEAEQAELLARMRLNESMLSATEKMASGMSDASSSFGDIGAKLDADLGFSKGLPGLADNLVRFLANLATAPLQGILSKIANPGGNTSQGGAVQSYAQYGMPYYGGYPGDAALLSRVPSGTYTQENRGDLTQGLADCSSAVEDLVNMLDGVSTGGASVTTHNMEEFLRSRGFMPGPGGPGDMRVGFDAGHAQATLPGGTHFNWGSQEAASAGGRSGQGAGVMANQFFRPVASMPVGTPSTPFMPQASGNPGGLVIPPPMSSAAANADPALTNPALSPGLPAPGTVPTGGPLSSGMPTAFTPSYAPTTPSEQAAPTWQSNAKGLGVGGGLIGMALQAASAAGGVMAPGAGQAGAMAAQMGLEAINRTIAFGGEAASIAVQGLMDTFSVSDPDGGGSSGQSSWFTRIAGSLASARPAGNMNAGKADQKSKVDPNAQQNQQQQQPQGPQQTNNINIAIPPDRAGHAQKLANDMTGAMYDAHINPG